jgi:putative serine protease PepD
VRTGGGQGTGFLVDDDGTLVTNAHVVGESSRAQVQFGDDGRTVDARVAGTDPSSDLAVLKVDASAVSGIQPLPLADSSRVQVGDEVVAIGNPFGLDRTATAGIVSALEREITAPNGFSIDEVIQTDAPINPGNSGGPLLDARGQVIGVNSQILSGGGRGNVGIGFAVPSDTVREVVPRLKRGETIERAYLGIATGAGPNGVTVQSTTAGSPAQRAGLRAGDVVTSVDGARVADPADVAGAIDDQRPGDSIEIEVSRGGDAQTITVELGTRPANPAGG